MRLAAFSLAFLVLAVSAAAAAKPKRAALRVTGTTPLVVQGEAFLPREKVQLLVSTGKPLRAVVRTGPLGGFRYTFSHRVSRCASVSIQAIGSRGSRASFTLDQPHCAPIQG